MISSGKIGANASGPTGSMVAGLSGGSSWKGRSGTRLYQDSGMRLSSRMNLVCCMGTSGLLACQLVSLQLFGAPGVAASSRAGRGESSFWVMRRPRTAGMLGPTARASGGDGMSKAGHVAENPVTGERVVVRVGTEDSGGGLLVSELFVRP